MHIHKIRSKINKSNLIYTQCLLMSMYTRYIPSYFCSHLRSQPDIFKRDNIVVHQLWRDFSAGWQVGSPLLWAHISVWTAHMQHFPLFAAAAPSPSRLLRSLERRSPPISRPMSPCPVSYPPFFCPFLISSNVLLRRAAWCASGDRGALLSTYYW
jgi:hypothetical protein